MIELLVSLTFFLLTTVMVSAGVGNDIGGTLATHPLWIQEDLAWEQDPGEKQAWAAAEVLYFGQLGEFGIFDGIVLRQGKKLALGEGEGQLDHRGRWKAVDDIILVDYRLVVADKIMHPAGQKPPEVPGPTQHGEIKLDVLKNPDSRCRVHMKFGGKTYEMATGFEASEITSHFKALERIGKLGSGSQGSQVDLGGRGK